MHERISQELEPYEMSPEEEVRADAAIVQAEHDIEQLRAADRWGFSEGTIRIERPAAEARIPD